MRLRCVENRDSSNNPLDLIIGKYYEIERTISMVGSLLIKEEYLRNDGMYQFYLMNERGYKVWYSNSKFDVMEYFRNITINEILE